MILVKNLISGWVTPTMGRNPIPRNIWTTNTIAVAPYAADLDPVDKSIDARMKQTDKPLADIISKGRRPKRSTVL